MADTQKALSTFRDALVSELDKVELTQVYHIKDEIVRVADSNPVAGELAMTLAMLEFALAQEKKYAKRTPPQI